MFPIAHAVLIRTLTGTPSTAHYLGSIWPDMLFASPLSHTQSHRSGTALRERVTAPGELRDFVAGVVSHGSEPHGFDWYSDEEWGSLPGEARGFAFQHARTLAEGAAKVCDVAPADGWWKAHNLVEMAAEHILYGNDPAPGRRLAEACGDTALHARIATDLCAQFGFPADALAEPMRRFPEVVTFAPASFQILAERYALQVRIKHPGAIPDSGAIARLIEQAEGLILPDFEAFMRECQSRVGTLLSSLALI